MFGRKIKNTLEKISDVGSKALPIVEAGASMLGFPELGGALSATRTGLSHVNRLKNNVEDINDRMKVFH